MKESIDAIHSIFRVLDDFYGFLTDKNIVDDDGTGEKKTAIICCMDGSFDKFLVF
jgi:hypothetical protein